MTSFACRTAPVCPSSEHGVPEERAAGEAIRRHSDHIERCDRVIEAGERGVPLRDVVEALGLRCELEESRTEILNLTTTDKKRARPEGGADRGPVPAGGRGRAEAVQSRRMRATDAAYHNPTGIVVHGNTRNHPLNYGVARLNGHGGFPPGLDGTNDLEGVRLRTAVHLERAQHGAVQEAAGKRRRGRTRT